MQPSFNRRLPLAFSILPMIILVNLTEIKSLRILCLFPAHSKSHFLLGEALFRGLASRGHQVDVYSHFPLDKPPANYTDYSLAGSLPSLANNFTYEIVVSEFPEKISISKLIKYIGDPVCKLLELPIFRKLIRNPPEDPPYDIVVVETFVFNCYLAFGRHLDVPMIGVSTMNLFDWFHEPLGNPVNLGVYGSVFSQDPSPKTFFARLYNVYLCLRFRWSFEYHSRLTQDRIVRESFGSDYPSVVDLPKDLALVLVNYHPAINGAKPHVPSIVPIAGIHVVDNVQRLTPEVQKFLDDSEHGFVYFSFGTMVRIETFPARFLKVLYSTFKTIAPVRVLMRIFDPDILPPGLPSNVITSKWLPQVEVLKHKNIKVFVTHGGLLGTQEAIYHGVPMIGFPMYGDQHFNMKSYVNLNMAIQLRHDDLTEAIFTNAVHSILKDPKYKRSVEKVRDRFRDVPMSPVDTAVFWVEHVARHGRDVLRSPLIDMPWWKVSMLDVYGFVVVILLLALYIAKITLGLLFKTFSTRKLKRSGVKVKVN